MGMERMSASTFFHIFNNFSYVFQAFPYVQIFLGIFCWEKFLETFSLANQHPVNVNNMALLDIKMQ